MKNQLSTDNLELTTPQGGGGLAICGILSLLKDVNSPCVTHQTCTRPLTSNFDEKSLEIKDIFGKFLDEEIVVVYTKPSLWFQSTEICSIPFRWIESLKFSVCYLLIQYGPRETRRTRFGQGMWNVWFMFMQDQFLFWLFIFLITYIFTSEFSQWRFEN